MSPEPPSPGDSRAAEVLDRLVRDRPVGRRRSWQLRQLVGHAPTDPERSAPRLDAEEPDRTPGSASRSAGRRAWPTRVRWVTVVGILVVAGVVASLLLARRPPPIDDRLPMTSAADGAGGVAAGPASEGAADPADDDGASSATGDAAGSDAASRPEDGVDSGEVVVHVAGAVAAPGVVRLAATGRIVDAVAAAGGLRPDADPDRVNLAAPVADGQRIVIPVLGQPLPAEVLAEPGIGATPGGPAPVGATPAGGGGTGVAVVDLNTATAEQLDTLPGVGPATAAAILAHRDETGPFGSVDELIDVRGIGEAKLEALRDLVVVTGG